MNRKPRHLRSTLLSVLALALVFSQQTAHSDVTVELVVSSLNRPIYVTAPAGDARLFIVEQRGQILILEGGSVSADPFLDIDSLATNISSFSERGLLGLAFHPDFALNRYFFVHYTDNSGNTVIARYEVEAGNPNKADHSSAEIVFTTAQPFSNHNGGQIEFGPDGFLYIGLGDGGSSGDPGNRAQNLGGVLGKMLRIDVDPLPYTIPLSNPFVDTVGAREEIWAYGLRNPYRFSFDRTTGDLWIGDVGQNLWEEIDYQPAASAGGENYGWRLSEGLHCFNPPSGCGLASHDLPVHEYGHGGGNCSVTGGYVYRGSEAPELAGKYIFADYCSGRFWALTLDGDTVSSIENITSQLNPGSPGPIGSPAGFGEDGFGELYVIDRAGTSTGEVYKIITDPTGIDGEESFPATFSLSRLTPNPTATGARFEMAVDRPGLVSAEIYDVTGRRIRTILSEPRGAGVHAVDWNGESESGRRLGPGVYFLQARHGGRTVTKRVDLVR